MSALVKLLRRRSFSITSSLPFKEREGRKGRDRGGGGRGEGIRDRGRGEVMK